MNLHDVPLDQRPFIADDVILMGLTGSRAYGLDVQDSDYDWKGVFQAPTSDVLGLSAPTDKTRTSHGPDSQVHELFKFVQLSLKCNPTLMEMLWLDDYVCLTDAGAELVANRELFLWSPPVRGSVVGQASQKLREILELAGLKKPQGSRPKEGVGDAYISYAKDQFQRVVARDGTYKSKLQHRTAKHTRHMFRLLLQGRELLTTGEMSVRVSAEDRERLFMLGDLPISEMVPLAEAELEEFKKIKSVLPDRPRRKEVSDLLVGLRLSHLQGEIDGA